MSHFDLEILDRDNSFTNRENQKMEQKQYWRGWPNEMEKQKKEQYIY